MSRNNPTPVRAALQDRSRRTEERILSATEALLAEGGMQELTVDAIAERAHVSVGAFYKRFQGKSSLLPMLLERVQTEQTRQLLEFISTPVAQDATLRGRLTLLLQIMAEAQLAQRELFRALVTGAWSEPQAKAEDPHAQKVMQHLLEWLSARGNEIGHPQPDLALSVGLFTMLHTLQSALLLRGLPSGVPMEVFTTELACLLCRYLMLADDV